jgi:hypothetical protein
MEKRRAAARLFFCQVISASIFLASFWGKLMNLHLLLIRAVSLFAAASAVHSSSSYGQDCTPCGSGVMGAFNATSNTTLPGGTYEFTTFNIDPGVVVTVTGPDPLVIYATGAVTINGSLLAIGNSGGDGVISISAGTGGAALAGGASGGDGVFSGSTGPLDGTGGGGDGGGGGGSSWSGGGGAGYAADGQSSGGVGGFAGVAYGDPAISVLVGGSGGGGGSGGYSCGGGGGGGGGGAIWVRSCVSVALGAAAVVDTNGGSGGSDGTGNCGGGGGGSGGSLVLSAPTIAVNGQASGVGGIGGASYVPDAPYYGVGGNGADGRIHFQTTAGIFSGVGTVSPPAQVDMCTFDRIFADDFE